jgi:hypothetical protein
MPAKQADTIYRLKITLKGIRPPIWRRVEVPGGISLLALHGILNEAMGWLDGHLHDFEIDGVEYTTPDIDMDAGMGFGQPTEDDARWRLDAVVSEPGAKFRYRYDFGDGWEHDVVVEAIGAPEAGIVYPRVTKGRRRCPPEDCGGPWGYQELLEALADPKDPENRERIEWAGGPFDPEAFSVEEINEALAARFRDLKPLRRSTRRAPTPRPDPASRLRQHLMPDVVRVAADGTVRLPADAVAAMGLTGGGDAILVTVGGGVMLMRDPRSGAI